jgi:hypothetical protein
MAHYGGRLLLAHNKILYPGFKWFTTVLAEAPEKPGNFLELFAAVQRQPCQSHAQAFRDCLVNYCDWGVTFPQAISRFINDVEWHWRKGHPYVYNW